MKKIILKPAKHFENIKEIIYNSAKEYGETKETAARLFPDNIDQYIEFKSPCIEKLYRMCGLK